MIWRSPGTARRSPSFSAATTRCTRVSRSSTASSLDGAQRERLRLRLQKYLDDRIARDLAPLRLAVERAATQPDLRGMLHRLTESLGLIPGDEGDALPPRSRAALKAIGVKAGRFGPVPARTAEAARWRHAPAVVVRAEWPRGAPTAATRSGVTAAGPLVNGLRAVRSGLGSEDLVVIDGVQRAKVGVKVTKKMGRITPPNPGASPNPIDAAPPPASATFAAQAN